MAAIHAVDSIFRFISFTEKFYNSIQISQKAVHKVPVAFIVARTHASADIFKPKYEKCLTIMYTIA